MKVIILAGGLGSRLGPEGELIPKPLVRIGEKPIIWHIMKYYSHFGFNEFIVCLGYKGDMIKNYFYNYGIMNSEFTIDFKRKNITTHSKCTEKNWRVTLVDTGQNALKGARIKRIEKYLKSDVNMLTYGDGLSDVDLGELLKYHKKNKKILTVTGVHLSARFGEIREKKGKVLSFYEKPNQHQEMKNGGFMVFNRKLMSYLNDKDDCDLEKGPLERLAGRGEVMVYKHKGNWECMDAMRDVQHLNDLWRNNEAFWKVWDDR